MHFAQWLLCRLKPAFIGNALPAYSGGTARDLHPLRMAAGLLEGGYHRRGARGSGFGVRTLV